MTEINNISDIKKFTLKIERPSNDKMMFTRAEVDELLEGIELQNKELEMLQNDFKEMNRRKHVTTEQLKEDREELKKCRAVIAKFNKATIQLYQGYGEQELEIIKLNEENHSLITTIESLQAENKRLDIAAHTQLSLGNTVCEMQAVIESQKEEIEKQKVRATEFLNSKIDTANAKHMLDTKNMLLQTEIESLKAITELAVKGLEQFANRGSWTEVQHIESLKDYAVWTGDTNEPWIDAKSTLSEIERLSHELDK